MSAKRSHHQKVLSVVPSAIERSGLHYVEDAASGIKRVRRGRGFSYLDSSGKQIKETASLRRIKTLAIPPAWHEVWIAASDRAHIQATGRDDRGRKQYRYHPDWSLHRDTEKFDRLMRFALALPALRMRISSDLASPGLSREKVIASAVQLLFDSHIRVGNECYAQENKSYGLTTLRCHHVDIEGARIELHFVGKAGKHHNIVVHDQAVARVLERCRKLSGALLFRFTDESGVHPITSTDVNRYLREVCGHEFSAKDVRTWAGTVLATNALTENVETKPVMRQLNEALREVASHLGNTLAICRKSYVHPGLMEMHKSGTLAKFVKSRSNKPAMEGLTVDETVTLAVLAKIKQSRTISATQKTA